MKRIQIWLFLKKEKKEFVQSSGNHGLGYAFVPPISPYENPLPLNEETSTTMAPTTTHQPLQQPSTTASTITQVHTSPTSEPKMAPLKPLYTPTMPPVVKAVTNRVYFSIPTLSKQVANRCNDKILKNRQFISQRYRFA